MHAPDSSRRPIVLAAAAAVAVLLAAALVFTTSGDGGDDLVVAGVPDTLLPPEGADPLVACGVGGQFRASALDGLTGAEDADDPAARALRDVLEGPHTGITSDATGWRRLAETDDAVLFASGDPPTMAMQWIERRDGEWRPGLGGVGQCTLRLAIEGVDTAEWALDPAHPTTPETTTLHLLVTETACTGGESATGRIVGPDVHESADEVRIAVAVRPLGGPEDQLRTCPENPPTPVTVPLDAQLGQRKVLDGLLVPPGPPTGTALSATIPSLDTVEPGVPAGDPSLVPTIRTAAPIRRGTSVESATAAGLFATVEIPAAVRPTTAVEDLDQLAGVALFDIAPGTVVVEGMFGPDA